MSTLSLDSHRMTPEHMSRCQNNLYVADSLEALCFDTICELIRRRPDDADAVVRRLLGAAVEHRDAVIAAEAHGFLSYVEVDVTPSAMKIIQMN